ncbi:uncharacterized protein LOC114260704 isoform X1 [Camellia sinensis]|uniref:uncharacterized protein LOC114260704 isoform X1 n=1 Tax=Camellia sinensis TaxID=4442 RepID=UPI001035B8E2|nr:uncharacterized protein LOC114260704 isoform X1 [Camellia sinensis]
MLVFVRVSQKHTLSKPLTLTLLLSLSRHWSVPLSSLHHRRASLRHRRSSLRHHRASHLCLELPSSRGEDLQSKCLLELYGLENCHQAEERTCSQSACLNSTDWRLKMSDVNSEAPGVQVEGDDGSCVVCMGLKKQWICSRNF